MRKRSKYARNRMQAGASPIVFALNVDLLRNGNLRLRASLDAVVRGDGSDDDIAALECAAQFCLRMCDRLVVDQTCDEVAVAQARQAAQLGRDAVAAVQQRFNETAVVGCTDDERLAMHDLVCVNEEIDKVATRRQSRDVFLEIIAEGRAVGVPV